MGTIENHRPQKLRFRISALLSALESHTDQQNGLKLAINATEDSRVISDWKTISFDEEESAGSPTYDEHWLQHEIEHRTNFPGSVKRLLLWRYVAWTENVPEYCHLVSLVANLLTDSKLLSLNSNYSNFLRHRIKKLEKPSTQQRSLLEIETTKLLLSPTAQVGRDAKTFLELLLNPAASAEEKIRYLSIKLGRHFIEPPLPELEDKTIGSKAILVLEPHDIDIVIRDLLAEGATASSIEKFFSAGNIFLKDSVEESEHLKEFDQYLKNTQTANQKLDTSQVDFHAKIVSEYMLSKSSSFGSSEKQDVRNFLVEFTAESSPGRLTSRELKHIFRYAAKLQLHSVFMEFLRSARGSLKSSSRPLENWSMGDDFRVLSLADTYRLFGVFIPGVSAVKRKEPTVGKLSTNIAILLDTSGSMAFENRIDLEREIGFCLIETARRGSDTVTFVPFNSEVDPSNVSTSRNYDHIEDALTSIQPYGMSNLCSALEIAVRTASVTNRQDTFIMTDGQLWDADEIQPLMQKLTMYGTTSLFLVGTTENTKKNLSEHLVSAIPNLGIYDCNIREKKVVSAISAYMERQQGARFQLGLGSSLT